VIARLWHGRTPLAKAEEYGRLLERTGLPDYRATPGNRGVLALRRADGDVAEFLLVSFWESFESIRRCAGSDIEKARYYPEDDAFLLEKEDRVVHYDVLSGQPVGEESE
jgi:heme-degrading monooxygenase HmoA